MIRNRNRRHSLIDGAARIVRRQHPFDDDWTFPDFPDPDQVGPGRRGFRQGSIDIDQRHLPLARDDHVRKPRQAAVKQVVDEPARTRENLRDIWNLLQQSTADEFLHAVAVIALANSRHRSINRDDQRGKSSNPRSLDCGLGSPAPAHQIELVENRSSRPRPYVLELVSGNRRKNIARAGLAGRSRGRHFASGMHEPAVSDRRKHERNSEFEAQNSGGQTAIANRYRMTRPKSDVVKYPAIFAECDLAFGAAVEVVEHRLRNSFARDGPEVFDANHSGRSYRAGKSCHGHSNIQDIEAGRYGTTVRHRTRWKSFERRRCLTGPTLSCPVREQTSPWDVPYTW